MVHAPSSLLLAAALVAMLSPQLADATSILVNPVTPAEAASKLNRRNPAYGGPPASDMVQPFLPAEDPTLSRAEVTAVLARGGNVTDDGTRARRKLEVTSADVQRLEAHFRTAMDTNVNSIYSKYASANHAPVPWPSGYWPTYLDSINYRWTNEASPAEKYAKAFGKDVTQFKNLISSKIGIDSQAYGPRTCSSNSQCSGFRDGSYCGRRDGSASGYCIPTWYGICHAWAPAAILEAEPSCNVVKNGVTFRPFDIKGLMTAIYDGADLDIVFTGARYNGAGSPRDEYGRYTDPFERDLGPGYFHIAVTNILGRFRQSFIVDVNADAEVWNQPVRGYSTTKPTIMTPTQAAQTYFGVAAYPFNSAAKSIAYMQMTFKYINELNQDGPLVSTGIVDRATVTRQYTYLLELDANQNIIGGEWLGNSQTNHPDFLWFADRKPAPGTVTELGLSYNEVADLLLKSTQCGTGTTAPPPGTTAPPPGTTAPPPGTTAPPPGTTAPPPVTTAPPNPGSCGNDQIGPKPCPSGQYCQPWNPSFYQCRTINAKCGKQEVAVDYYGADIVTYQLLLPEQCCDKCYATPGCKAYTFVNYNPDGKAYCYLKTGTGQKSAKVGVVSAVISSPTEPVSGAACGNDQTGPLACASGEYCQPWNPSFYQCRRLEAKCGQQETGVDYYGDDIVTYQLLLPEQCCAQCFATAGCKAYTFVNYNPDGKAYCYLKKATGRRSAKVGAVSAKIVRN